MKAEDLLIPDNMIPDISTAPDIVDELEEPEEEENEEMEEFFAELLSYPLATVEDIMFNLDDDEFEEKYQKFKRRAIQTKFAANLAKYLDEMGVDWLNDPRISLALSGLMFMLFVAMDFKQTADRKKKEKEMLERQNRLKALMEMADQMESEEGGEE